MDDDMLRESLADFDSLWQRVTGRADRPSAQGTYEPMLPQLIRDENCAAACSAALAQMFRGDGRAMLLRHAADARRHLRRLRAEYFIATGTAGGAGADCRTGTGKLGALRAAYLQAGDMAERYERAAEHAESGELRDVLAAFAADERRRARETRALLVECF